MIYLNISSVNMEVPTLLAQIDFEKMYVQTSWYLVGLPKGKAILYTRSEFRKYVMEAEVALVKKSFASEKEFSYKVEEDSLLRMRVAESVPRLIFRRKRKEHFNLFRKTSPSIVGSKYSLLELSSEKEEDRLFIKIAYLLDDLLEHKVVHFQKLPE